MTEKSISIVLLSAMGFLCPAEAGGVKERSNQRAAADL